MADWEQLQGESNQHYSWFLAYRNLGPTRSLDRAYQVTKGNAGLQAPGAWADASSRNRWTERASAWDVHVLTQAGAAVVVRFVDAMRELAEQTIRGLQQHPPSNFSEALRAMEALSQLIPAESIAAVQEQHAPPLGTPPASPSPTVTVEVRS